MNDGKFDFGFAWNGCARICPICLAEARRNGASLPVTALCDAFYSEVEKWAASDGIRRACSPARALFSMEMRGHR